MHKHIDHGKHPVSYPSICLAIQMISCGRGLEPAIASITVSSKSCDRFLSRRLKWEYTQTQAGIGPTIPGAESRVIITASMV